MDVTVSFNRTPRMRWLLPAGCTEWHGLTLRAYRNGTLSRQCVLNLRARPPRVIVTRRFYKAGTPSGPEREWTWPPRRPAPAEA